ncbi:hypothetical protein [Streptomyces sp. NPDC001401]|uniref:hypothetical protein n=1 Tax=Streptomyces sp. NPDC001401 TaxID=3364570 RepID=UPI00368B3F15
MITQRPLSQEPPPGPSFEVVALRTTTRALPPRPRPALAALRAMVDGGTATRAALSATGWAASEVTGMLVGAYSPGARRFIAHASAIPRQIVPGLETGHCFGVAVVRGLADLIKGETLPDGAQVLALAPGRYSWSVLALRHRAR